MPSRSPFPSPTVTKEVTSPFGTLRIVASPVGIRAVLWEGEPDPEFFEHGDSSPEDRVLADNNLTQAAVELDEYFRGIRHTFDVPLDPRGTDFQLQVWQVLRSIPYAQTISYGEQARRLGDARKARAVGSANGRNPISIIVPCHRVIGSNGGLTGFAAGVDIKQSLLEHEQRFAPGRLSVRKADDDPVVNDMFSKGLTGPDGQPLNIFGVLAHHPAMLKRWLVFATHVLSKNTLNARDREILILRTGWNCRSRYEWGQHVLIGRQCGLVDAEIERIKVGPESETSLGISRQKPFWSTSDNLLLRAADELHRDQTVSDATWTELAQIYSTEQILDIIATVGNYHLVAMFLKSARVPLDAGVPDEPELR